MNNYEMALQVPHYDEEKLASSTVILADLIEKVPTKNIGVGQFVIGSSKVRPRLDDNFKRDEKMGIYLQLYNFQPDEKTQKPNGVSAELSGSFIADTAILDTLARELSSLVHDSWAKA